MNNVFILLLSTLLIACGGGSDGDKSKNLFSLWVLDGSDGDVRLDLEGVGYDEPKDYVMTFEDGSSCTCQLSLNGSQSEGTYILNYCSFDYGSGNTELNCNALNQMGTYTKTHDTLTIDGAGHSSEVYH